MRTKPVFYTIKARITKGREYNQGVVRVKALTTDQAILEATSLIMKNWAGFAIEILAITQK